jgi:hypothetical protein
MKVLVVTWNAFHYLPWINIRINTTVAGSAEMKTTKKDFDLFCDEATKWLGRFGLLDWDIYFKHTALGEDQRATANWSLGACSGVLSLNTNWTMDGAADTKNEEEICKIAFHEVCHVLLARFQSLAECRFIGDHEIDIEVHRLISVFQHVIWSNIEE